MVIYLQYISVLLVVIHDIASAFLSLAKRDLYTMGTANKIKSASLCNISAISMCITGCFMQNHRYKKLLICFRA